MCCVAGGGIVGQIQGKRFADSYKVILWKFSFPCGPRGSGLTLGLVVVGKLTFAHHSLLFRRTRSNRPSKSVLHLHSKVNKVKGERSSKIKSATD